MSFDSLSRECQLRTFCCYPNQESLKKVKELVAAGVNVHSRGSDGLSPLMRAALGYDMTPNAEAFFYLFHQKYQPFSLDEKVDGLELLGASYILKKDFLKGLNNWLDACRCRSTPKTCNPSVLLQRPFVKSEWTTSADIYILASGTSDGDREINLVYQAMLVRQRLLGAQNKDHVNTLCGYAFEYLTKDDYAKFLKLGLFCLEWTHIHGGSFSEAVVYLLKEMIFLLSAMSITEDSNRHLCNFSISMAILNWIAAQSKKQDEIKVEDARRLHWEDVFLECLVQLVVLLTEMPKTEEEDSILRNCVHGLVKSDLRNSQGYDMLKAACYPFSKFFEWHLKPELGYSPLPSAKVANLLIEVGTNPTSAYEA